MAVQAAATPVRSFTAVEAAWRALEAEAAAPSFFQSWTWMGCLAEERFDDPLLVEVREGNRPLGLALFNRRGRRLHLAESGEARLDAPFIEHNAPLLARDAGPEVLRTLLAAAWRAGRGGLVLSGVPPTVLEAAEGMIARRQERPAPFVDLAVLRAASGDALAAASGNTRHQLRRALRRYESRGTLRLERADGVAEALAWFEALAALHGQHWRKRGKPGAFADPFMLRFHRALIERAVPRGEVDVLRLTVGGAPVGHLYNFRLRGRVSAYQGGFDYEGAGRHEKPGLACHAMAIGRALEAGDEAYDFLAGAERYKLSLANAASPLVWAELVPRWSWAGAMALARHAAARLRAPARQRG